MALYFEIGAVLVAVLVFLLLLKFLFKPLHLLANSILGIVLFYLMNAFFGLGIPITWLSIGIVALGGVLGVVFVLVLHVTGLGF